jgi:hypothetical protein
VRYRLFPTQDRRPYLKILGMSKEKLDERLHAVANTMRAKFKETESVQHKGAGGTEREAILENFSKVTWAIIFKFSAPGHLWSSDSKPLFREFLPQNWVICQGPTRYGQLTVRRADSAISSTSRPIAR